MDAVHLLLMILLPLLIVLIAVCSASETSLFSLSRTDRLRLRRRSSRAGVATQFLLSRPRPLILTILLLTNAANIAYFVIVTVLERHIQNEALGIAFNAVLLVVVIVVGDLLPKLIAAPRRVAFAGVLAPWLVGVLRVAGPVTSFLEHWLVEPVIRLLRPSRAEDPRVVSVEELGTLIDLSARSGVIEEDEQQLLADVIRLGSIRIRDVMMPRVAMPWLNDRFGMADVVRQIKRAPLPRLPVFRGSLDGKPFGLLDTRSFLPAAEAAGDPAKIASIRDASLAKLEPIVFIPERARLDQLLDLLRKRGAEEALCVDEYGAVVGMVTINEVVRELVQGAPAGETGVAEAIERRSESTWVVPGRLPARQLAMQLGELGASGEDVSTVAGLFYQKLGKVPAVGDSIRLRNIRLSIEAMSNRTIDRVAVSVETGGRP
jgi:CBS domain containing-hemolysin-like protein